MQQEPNTRQTPGMLPLPRQAQELAPGSPGSSSSIPTQHSLPRGPLAPCSREQAPEPRGRGLRGCNGHEAVPPTPPRPCPCPQLAPPLEIFAPGSVLLPTSAPAAIFQSHCPGAAPRWLRGVGWTLGGARGCPCRAPRGGSGAEGHPRVPGQGSHPACWGYPRAERSQKLALGCHKHPAKSNTSPEHRPSKSHLRTRLPRSGARAGSPPPRGAPSLRAPSGTPPPTSTAPCQPWHSAGPGVPGEAGVQIRRANRSRFLQEPLPALLPGPWTLSHPPRWQGCCQPRGLARGGGGEKQSLGHGGTGCDGDSGAAGWALHGSPSSQPRPRHSPCSALRSPVSSSRPRPAPAKFRRANTEQPQRGSCVRAGRSPPSCFSP